MLNATATPTARLIRIAMEKGMTRAESAAYSISRRNAATALARYAATGRA